MQGSYGNMSGLYFRLTNLGCLDFALGSEGQGTCSTVSLGAAGSRSRGHGALGESWAFPKCRGALLKGVIGVIWGIYGAYNRVQGFPNLGYLFGGPHKYHMLGSIFGFPYLGKLPFEGKEGNSGFGHSEG